MAFDAESGTYTNGKPADLSDMGAVVDSVLITPDDFPHDARLGKVHEAPPLPKHAQLTDAQREEATTTGAFLREYQQFGKLASPMTPSEFHVGSGLSMVSMAIARRLHIKVSVTKIYPNLYKLFVGESTLHRKTTGLSVATGLMEAAGMIPMFTLAGRQTPEALSEDMSLNIPRTLDSWTDDAKEAWLKRRSLAAQRGWVLDEASHLLDSFNRDYSAGMLPQVLELYDSKDKGEGRNTKSSGFESVDKAYLTIFGCTTFEAMTEHMSKAAHWRNGLFARFALITSNETVDWQFWPQPFEYPQELIDKLRFIAFSLFGYPPHAEIISIKGEDDKPGYRKVEVMPLPDHTAFFGDGSWQLWERYSRAVTHELLYQAKKDGSIEPLLFPSYGRFPTMMIKVAMQMAVMDATQLPIVIEPRHIYAAQEIVESWRQSLHLVRAGGRISEGRAKADEIRSVLGQNGFNYTMRRDLLRAMNCTWSEIEQVVKDMEVAGDIEVLAHQPKRGPKSEKYRLLSPEEREEETVILS